MATQIYKVEAPDGKIIKVEGPEGASQEEVIAQAQRLYTPGEPSKGVMSTMADTARAAIRKAAPVMSMFIENQSNPRAAAATADAALNIPGAIANPFVYGKNRLAGDSPAVAQANTNQSLEADPILRTNRIGKAMGYEQSPQYQGSLGKRTLEMPGAVLSPVIDLGTAGGQAIGLSEEDARNLTEAGLTLGGPSIARGAGKVGKGAADVGKSIYQGYNNTRISNTPVASSTLNERLGRGGYPVDVESKRVAPEYVQDFLEQLQAKNPKAAVSLENNTHQVKRSDGTYVDETYVAEPGRNLEAAVENTIRRSKDTKRFDNPLVTDALISMMSGYLLPLRTIGTVGAEFFANRNVNKALDNMSKDFHIPREDLTHSVENLIKEINAIKTPQESAGPKPKKPSTPLAEEKPREIAAINPLPIRSSTIPYTTPNQMRNEALIRRSKSELNGMKKNDITYPESADNWENMQYIREMDRQATARHNQVARLPPEKGILYDDISKLNDAAKHEDIMLFINQSSIPELHAYLIERGITPPKLKAPPAPSAPVEGADLSKEAEVKPVEATKVEPATEIPAHIANNADYKLTKTDLTDLSKEQIIKAYELAGRKAGMKPGDAKRHAEGQYQMAERKFK
jgi:hypothetical protein